MSRDRVLEQLPSQVQRVVQLYAKRVGAAVGSTLESLHLYGSAVRGEYVEGRSNLNMLLTLTDVTGDRLRSITPALSAWKKEQVVSLVLTGTEVREWAAQFPLEFGDLLDHRLLLAGRDPFSAIRPDPARLMEAILRESRENLLRVRQRYIEGGASTESALILMPLSVTALGACIRGLLRLWDQAPVAATDQALQRVCDRLGVDAAPLLDAWALRCGRISPGQLEIPRLFDRYVGGLQAWVSRVSEAATLSRV